MYENGMNNFEHMEQGNLNGNENGGGMNKSVPPGRTFGGTSETG